MICKECEYFKGTIACKHPDNPFPLNAPESECALTRSRLSCRDCNYWIEADGFDREDNVGGCTYGGGYHIRLLEEKCSFNEPYKTQVEVEMGFE